MRMKTITSLADGGGADPEGSGGPKLKRRKKKKNQGSVTSFLLPFCMSAHLNFPLEDDFGADDSDWLVYKDIVRKKFFLSNKTPKQKRIET